MSDSFIPRANVPLAQVGNTVHAKHPFRDTKTHDLLLAYVQARLNVGKSARDARLTRMVAIDKSVAGWMKLSDEDKARLRRQDTTGIPQAITLNLPLNWVQMDDMMTYYAQTFAPNRGMFYQMGKPDETKSASQIVTLMNNHALYTGSFGHVIRTLFSILKYNVGGLYGGWSRDMGPKLGTGPNQEQILTNDVIWSGNKMESLDMYNTFWDPLVAPAEVYLKGEWCARASIVSHFTLQSKAAEGLYFNCEDELESQAGLGISTYYRHPPSEANMVSSSDGSDTSWVSILSATPGYSVSNGYELVEVFIKLNPVQMNLIPAVKANGGRNRFEIWRITILNNSKIIDATYMNNMHGYLPFFMGRLHDDSMGDSTKSAAEIIQPLQDFASFLLNTHVRATRKNIWGLTIYDPSIVDLSQIPEGEVSARVPAKNTGMGKDITKSIWEHSGVLDTKQTMTDLESVMTIINQFFPTTSLPSQIASIDRAVDSQVAAVQQGANRRMQKGARLLDDSLFRPLRFAFYYNIIQYQQDGAQISDFYGRPITVNLTELRNTDLPFIIGQGLKALDRMATASAIQNIIFALIQNPVTAQRIDLLALMDYWTSMIDADIDMNQFEMRQQPAAAPAPGAEGAAGGAGASPIQPMTDPATVTEPLRG